MLEFQKVRRSNKIIQYLLLLKCLHKQAIFIVYSGRFKEPIIVDETNISRFIGAGSFVVNISDMLYVGRTEKFKERIDELIQKYDSRKEVYEELVQDLKNIPYMGDEFHRAKINLQLKGGKPHMMQAEAKTTNTDYYYWKRVLGDHREINEKTRNGKTEIFDVKKKYKY